MITSLRRILTSEVDGSQWSFDVLDGRPYVVVFGNMKCAEDVTQIIAALQSAPETVDLDIVQVAHVSGLPKPLQKLATRSLRKAKEKQVAERAALRARLGLAAEDGEKLRFALDWTAQLTEPAEFTHHQKEAVTLLVDADGTVASRLEGPEVGARVRAWYASHVSA
ncbi:hypothetical protein ABH935_008356 [Catenulispora sp. GAS73]|uniref:hypothetical protein n=1 Tax=Catenulispora sp. GAS73 TaxID=3156269 RepID=UPI003513EE2A